MDRFQEIAAIQNRLDSVPTNQALTSAADTLMLLDEIRALRGAVKLARPFVDDAREMGDPDAAELLPKINRLLNL